MSVAGKSLRTAEGRFSPGQSGNPAGRPKGSRNKATLVAEALLDEATGAVVAKAIDEALAGDALLLRTVFRAICKKDPGRTIELDLPEERFGDPVAFLEATMRAVALGEITPQEAALLARIASVMVQAQRLKLRIELQKAKSDARQTTDVMPPGCDPGVDPAIHESGRTAVETSHPISRTADVDGRDNPGYDDHGRKHGPAFGLYFRARAKDPSIAPVFSGDAGSGDERGLQARQGVDACIAPVFSRGDERKKAA
jgi:hypothetical protein